MTLVMIHFGNNQDNLRLASQMINYNDYSNNQNIAIIKNVYNQNKEKI